MTTMTGRASAAAVPATAGASSTRNTQVTLSCTSVTPTRDSIALYQSPTQLSPYSAILPAEVTIFTVSEADSGSYSNGGLNYQVNQGINAGALTGGGNHLFAAYFTVSPVTGTDVPAVQVDLGAIT